MDIPIVLSICVITCLRKITNKNNSFKAIRIFHNRKNRWWIDYAFSLAVYYVLWCSNFCQMVYPNVMCFILIIYVTFFQTLEMFVTFKEILPKFLWIWRRFPPELKMSEVRFELFLSSIKFDWVFWILIKICCNEIQDKLKASRATSQVLRLRRCFEKFTGHAIFVELQPLKTWRYMLCHGLRLDKSISTWKNCFSIC